MCFRQYKRTVTWGYIEQFLCFNEQCNINLMGFRINFFNTGGGVCSSHDLEGQLDFLNCFTFIFKNNAVRSK